MRNCFNTRVLKIKHSNSKWGRSPINMWSMKVSIEGRKAEKAWNLEHAAPISMTALLWQKLKLLPNAYMLFIIYIYIYIIYVICISINIPGSCRHWVSKSDNETHTHLSALRWDLLLQECPCRSCRTSIGLQLATRQCLTCDRSWFNIIYLYHISIFCIYRCILSYM